MTTAGMLRLVTRKGDLPDDGGRKCLRNASPFLYKTHYPCRDIHLQKVFCGAFRQTLTIWRLKIAFKNIDNILFVAHASVDYIGATRSIIPIPEQCLTRASSKFMEIRSEVGDVSHAFISFVESVRFIMDP